MGRAPDWPTRKSTGSFMAYRAFVDTSGFYSLLVRRDPRHEEAKAILASAASKGQLFLTSDYIIDETATLLRARGHGHLLRSFFDSVLHSKACRLEWMDASRFEAAQALMLKKEAAWSFTDCFSFVLMKEFRVKDALTSDAHFREAGYAPLLV